jgi:release factor glutamine methyltransferase
MTISIWLSHAIDRLKSAGIATARLDSQLLLADKMERDRGWVLAHPEIPLTEETINQLNGQLEERAKHVPLAYIRGKVEFYGREFIVDRRVLEPRPESETMIDVMKKLPPIRNKEAVQIIDVGTGSGALAITAKLELPGADVVATDIDAGSLQVAQANAAKLQANIEFAQGDMLTPVKKALARPVVITLANLPYVPDDHQVNRAALFEPRIAIFGGPDGLDPFRKLFEQAAKLVKHSSFILTESLPPQHKKLEFIAARNGFRQTREEDFVQVFEGGHQQGVAYP